MWTKPLAVNSDIRRLNLLPNDRFKRVVLAAFLLLFALSCVRPPYPSELILQHIPTICAIAGLLVVDRYFPLCRTSFACIICFLLLHLLGARYLYTNLPYDEWLEALFGTKLTDLGHFRRNHYDRLVHLCYGLLMTIPAIRIQRHFWHVSRAGAAVVAIQFILATSALYEIAEWNLAMILAPEWADRYNGQQGDMWDAQKDMALALIGSICSATLHGLWRNRFTQVE